MNLKKILPEALADKINWERLKLRNSGNKARIEAENWRQSDRTSAPPHGVKQEAIKELQKKFKINVLVETGTFQGEMVYAQRKNFKKIYSIELSKELYGKALKNLSGYGNVELLHGDSGEMLKFLIKKIDEPALFWLDGHYSGFETAKGILETPILAELKTILDSDIKHFILIDDARLFTGEKDYPELKELEEYIKNFGKNYSFAVDEDIIRLIPE